MVFGGTSPSPASVDLSTLDGTNGFVLNGASANDKSGIKATAEGDYNGDGVNDILIGAFQMAYLDICFSI